MWRFDTPRHNGWVRGTFDGDGHGDSDGDGIPDPGDDCPSESGGAATGGCPDRDGGGTRDSDDECPDDPEAAAEPCFIATASGPTLDLPAGAEQITVEIDIRADVPGPDGYVRAWLDAESGTETIYAQVTPGGTGFGFTTRSADVSRFAGETVTLRVEKAGDASAAVRAVRLIVDSDGDGLTDREERDGFPTGWCPRPAWTTPVASSPRSSRTSRSTPI